MDEYQLKNMTFKKITENKQINFGLYIICNRD